MVSDGGSARLVRGVYMGKGGRRSDNQRSVSDNERRVCMRVSTEWKGRS